jgi:hypothetical protein
MSMILVNIKRLTNNSVDFGAMSMPINRLLGMLREQNDFIATAPRRSAAIAPAFVAYPVAFSPSAWQQHLYQTAFEQAQAAQRPVQQQWDEIVLWN